MYRLFVAIALPESVIEAISWIQAGVPGARWVDVDQLHLTLAFLGEVDALGYDDVVNALATVRAEPFELSLKGLGHFPPRGRPKVLWVGVQPNEALATLRATVVRRLKRHGLSLDHRKYVPHVTIARLNGTSTGRVARFLMQNTHFEVPSFEVEEFHLYRSVLHGSGAEHHIEHSFTVSI